MLKAAIFDLDGVIVNTVPVHFNAWKQMFNEHGYKFDFEDYKHKVDGIPRIDGATAIMSRHSKNEILEASHKKQGYFLTLLEKDPIPVFDSTIFLIDQLIENKIKVGVISSSKNCIPILKKIKLFDRLGTVVDGHAITKGKPDPQIFLMAAEKLHAPPKESVVFEDAVLGVEAAKRAEMKCVGIDRYNQPDRLKKADIVVKDVSEINLDQLRNLFSA